MSTSDERSTVDHVARFVQMHQRWPSSSASTDYERSLGVWLGEQRAGHAAGTLDHFRREALDHRIPGWILPKDDAWMEYARGLADHILFKRSTPRTDSEITSERTAAYWLRTQVSEHRMGTLRLERQLWLDQHCPGWLQPSTPLFGQLGGRKTDQDPVGESAG